MNAMSVVSQYSRLQRRLLTCLFSVHPPEDKAYFRDIEPGVLCLEGVEWSYRRHGAGLIFRSLAGVVDAHVAGWMIPGGVDAWRLLQYCESRQLECLDWNGRSYDVRREAAVVDLLAELREAKLLVEWKHPAGHLIYSPVNDRGEE